MFRSAIAQPASGAGPPKKKRTPCISLRLEPCVASGPGLLPAFLLHTARRGPACFYPSRSPPTSTQTHTLIKRKQNRSRSFGRVSRLAGYLLEVQSHVASGQGPRGRSTEKNNSLTSDVQHTCPCLLPWRTPPRRTHCSDHCRTENGCRPKTQASEKLPVQGVRPHHGVALFLATLNCLALRKLSCYLSSLATRLL